MDHERDHSNIAPPQAERLLHLAFPGDELSVRDALRSVADAVSGLAAGAPPQGVVEIVLAEALNNVVEHAYSGQALGGIDLELSQHAGALAFTITDDGHPMPDGNLPQGKAHDLSVATQDLPEGGFGWFLIHELTDQLSYERKDGRNVLMFQIPLTAKPFPD